MSPSAAKPKILLFGLPDPSSQQSLEDVAEVTIIPRKPYDETVQNIARAVKEHGPFIAFGVSPHSHLRVLRTRFTVNRSPCTPSHRTPYLEHGTPSR
jgi:hypothetical protein